MIIAYSMLARHCTYVMSPSSQDSRGWAILRPVYRRSNGGSHRVLGDPIPEKRNSRIGTQTVSHKSRAFNQHSSLPLHMAGIVIVAPLCANSAQGCGTEQSETMQWH